MRGHTEEVRSGDRPARAGLRILIPNPKARAPVLTALLGALLGTWIALRFGGRIAGPIAPLFAGAVSAPSALTLAGYAKERELAFIAIVIAAGIAGALGGRLLATRLRERHEAAMLLGVWVTLLLAASRITLP